MAQKFHVNNFCDIKLNEKQITCSSKALLIPKDRGSATWTMWYEFIWLISPDHHTQWSFLPTYFDRATSSCKPNFFISFQTPFIHVIFGLSWLLLKLEIPTFTFLIWSIIRMTVHIPKPTQPVFLKLVLNTHYFHNLLDIFN